MSNPTKIPGNVEIGGLLSASNLSGTNTGDQTITLTGDVTGSGSGSFSTALSSAAVTTAKIADASVTYTKIQNVASVKLLGNPSGITASASEIPLNSTLEFSTGNLQRAALTGDVTASAGSNTTAIGTGAVTTAKIADSAVTYAKIQNVTANVVLGNPNAAGGATAAPSEISMGASMQIASGSLQRAALTGDVTASANSNATTIATSAVTTTKIADANVTYAKIQNIAATRILGNAQASPTAPTELLLNTTLVFNAGANSIGRASLSGDVTASSGSNSVTINGNAVTYAKMQNVTAARLLGNPTGSLTVPSEISLGPGFAFSGSSLTKTSGGGISGTDVTTVSTTGTGQADLHSLTIAANSLTALNMGYTWTGDFVTTGGATPDTNTLKLFLNGTVATTLTLTSMSNSITVTGRFTLNFFWVTTNTIGYIASFNGTRAAGNENVVYNSGTVSVTTSSSFIIKVTGQCNQSDGVATCNYSFLM